jgi:hypothetical protein
MPFGVPRNSLLHKVLLSRMWCCSAWLYIIKSLDRRTQADHMIDRWLRLTNLLKAQQSNPDLSASTRKLIEAAYQQADRQGVVLPEPGFKDPVFAGMRFRKRIDPENVIATAEQLATFLAKDARKKAKETTRLRRQRAETAVLRAIFKGTHAPHKGPHVHMRRRHNCRCGCGRLCVNFFAEGHHVNRLVLMLRMIERGEMTREALPNDVPAFKGIRWRKCKNCDGWVPTTDLRGLPEQSLIGPECRARLRRMKRRHSMGLTSPEADQKIGELGAMVAEYKRMLRKVKPWRHVYNGAGGYRAKTPLDLWMMGKAREAEKVSVPSASAWDSTTAFTRGSGKKRLGLGSNPSIGG